MELQNHKSKYGGNVIIKLLVIIMIVLISFDLQIIVQCLNTLNTCFYYILNNFSLHKSSHIFYHLIIPVKYVLTPTLKNNI